MADRALTQEALIAGLRDIRLQSGAAGGLLGELLAALALGLFVAAVLGLALRIVMFARPRGVPEQSGAALEQLPDEAQKLALLRLLKERSPERYAVLCQRLYEVGGLPDLAQLRREVQQDV